MVPISDPGWPAIREGGGSPAVLPTRRRRMPRHALPGFRLALGFTLAYLGLIVLIPFAGLLLKTGTLGWADFVRTITDPRVMASYRLSFGLSLVAALINGLFGLLLAWALVRYEFPGKRLVDGMVDLPFALPTAVAGLALTALYAPKGLIGAPLLEHFGVRVAFTPLGVLVALTFIGLPFVVRTLQPVLADLSAEHEEAAACLGAGRWFTLRTVVFPAIWPALLTGVTLAFGRAVGEFGSVVFISGNLPFRTEITPLLIVIKLEQYDYGGAAALGFVMLLASFVILLAVNGLQWLVARRTGGAD